MDDIDERLKSIESRLTNIERTLTITTPKKPISPPEFVEPAKEAYQTPFFQTKPEPRPPAKPGNLLGLVATLCFILAATFIVKLVIDTGWLTPKRQIGLAYLLGLSLIGAGFKFLKIDREYASLLPGAGIIILYLTTIAANQFYAIFSFEVALVVIAMISILCIWLYTKIQHDTYPMIAAIGAYGSPLLLGVNFNPSYANFSLYYFVVCSFVFVGLSIWSRSRLLLIIAAYLAIFVNASVGFNINNPGMLLAVILAIHFLIFSIGTYAYSRYLNQPLNENESFAILPALILFYAMEYYFIGRAFPGFAPWISLGFLAVILGLYFSAKKWFSVQSLPSQETILAFATVVAFHSIYLVLLPTYVRPWLFPIIVLGLAWLPSKYLQEANKNFSELRLAFPYLAVLAIIAIEYVRMCGQLLETINLYWLLVSLVAIASIWTLFFKKKELLRQNEEYKYLLLYAAHLLTVIGLYQLAKTYGSLAVSASWLFYAVIILTLAFIRKDVIMGKSATIVLGIAAAKALLYDVASAPTIVRILCLLLTGIVLYGAGFLMRKFTAWKVNF